jgi:hypothetical protein
LPHVQAGIGIRSDDDISLLHTIFEPTWCNAQE